MSLAIFDLDNTLIGGDSDHSWGEFLVESKIVDAESHKESNDRFYQDYLDGTLDIEAYVDFALGPVKSMSRTQRENLHRQFMQEKIEALILPKAMALIEQHRQQGDTLLIITATNTFITQPIAKRLNIEHIMATDPELVDDVFTGKISGTPCFQEGKVKRLMEWLDAREENMEGSYFYSDSINDAPLLKKVDKPVAVDPDKKLEKLAQERQWPIISLR